MHRCGKTLKVIAGVIFLFFFFGFIGDAFLIVQTLFEGWREMYFRVVLCIESVVQTVSVWAPPAVSMQHYTRARFVWPEFLEINSGQFRHLFLLFLRQKSSVCFPPTWISFQLILPTFSISLCLICSFLLVSTSVISLSAPLYLSLSYLSHSLPSGCFSIEVSLLRETLRLGGRVLNLM